MRTLPLFLLGALLGCSHPVPLTAPQSTTSPASLAPLVTAVDATGQPREGMGALGFFRLQANSESAELIPNRAGQLTDTLEVIDITSFLTAAPCRDCVRIESFRRVSATEVGITIAIRHPFPAGDASLPISASNRADLHVFNVEGQLLSDGPVATFADGQQMATALLTNADGYSGYLDPVLDPLFPTAATAHPYRLHFADYSDGNFDPSSPTGFTSVTTPAPAGNLVMPQGSDWDAREYVLDLRNGPLDLRFAIGCTYGLPVNSRFQRFTPEYRVPQHLKKAASEVRLTLLQNSLTAQESDSSALLEVDVLDPSHGVAVGPGLGDMLADSSILQVSVECPGLLPATLHYPGSMGTGNGHNPADPWSLQIEIPNALAAPEGVYPVLVTVQDAYSAGQNTAPLLQGKDGIGPVPAGTSPLAGLFDIGPFRTFQTILLTVAPAGNPPPPWPLYMGNAAHQGGLGLAGPTGNFSAPSWTSGCADWNCWGNPLPIFLDATTAYFSNTGDGGSLPTQAVDLATRQVKWTKKFNDIPQNWLNALGISITPQGTVVLCHENQTGHLYGLDGTDGAQLWQIPSWGHSRADSYATTDADGNFILASSSCIGGCPAGPQGYYSFEPRTGSQNWYTPVMGPGYATPAFANNRVYVTNESPSQLLALDPSDGSIEWTYALGTPRGNAVSVHPDGGILAFTMDGLHCVDDQGTSGARRWLQAYNCPFYTGVGIGPDGTIHVVDYDNTFRRLDPATGISAVAVGGWEDGYACRPVIDTAGVTYFPYRDDALNLSYFVAVNPDGSEKWRYTAGAWIGPAGIPSAGALGQDGTVYTSVRHSGLIAFEDP